MQGTDEFHKQAQLIEIRPRMDDSEHSRIVAELGRHFAHVAEEPVPAAIATLLLKLAAARN